MFPLSFPLAAIRRFAGAGDVVLDPFCGRGTTNYAARLCGLSSFGVDSSTVAAAVASAKLANTTAERIVDLARTILADDSLTDEMPDGEFWHWAFHERTLRSLSRLRKGLSTGYAGEPEVALRA